MVSITVKPRGTKPSKRFPLTVDLPSAAPTVSDLKAAIAAKVKLNANRQRLTTADKKVLDDDAKTLKELGVADGDSLEIKDLGPQISWRTVFLTEYFGPLFIHPAFYFGSKLIYRREFEHSKMQKVALGLILGHYLKRELETIFVHRFSSATMPVFNVFKNSGHYWGLSGLLIAAPLYGPWNGASALAGSTRASDNWIYGWAGVWLFGQISNLITHLNLRSLRPPGTRTRAIPRGYGFDLVSCPNYFFETIVWVAFTFLTLDWASAIFTAVAVAQMYVWALKKHSRYRKEFGKDYPRRKAMFPFLA
ncbi:3-oxo-5-alpha-steroid 4-dehydrogenase-domain-containing protein [Leucosporidium creatinivorum]|uniref:3-oxo-5-alpha-steroid 4-dehydrogenase-domain-containing protein n=1 Tax=Leucosporidium creatinivorum TaxID=106004 RepID=A0A1Y2EH97_9BASI|nr:3-oxo-5-alpha-steroid 4-dehydrogenase-domain-containing protein [Leucosporidium creatinivorum]